MQPTLLAALLALALCACDTADDDDDDRQIRTVPYASAASLPPVVSGQWVLSFAAEDATGDGGTDLNGDGDVSDAVAVVVEIDREDPVLLGVAARRGAGIDGELYVVVDEAEHGENLEPTDSGEHVVLLHWSASTEELTFVDLLASADAPFATATERLYYLSGDAPMGPDDTNVRFVEPDAPTSFVTVETDGEGQVWAHWIDEQDDLIVALAEPFVPDGKGAGEPPPGEELGVALLDGSDPTARLLSTGLAAPVVAEFAFDAEPLAVGDWLVAFLVSEEGQGEDLNDPDLFGASWLPESCPDLAADGVQADQEVLFYLHFADWAAGASDPANTGLVGRRRALALDTFVATLTPEEEIGCDLNGDGDEEDTIARWIEAVPPGAALLPPGGTAQMIAAAAVPGGSRGLSSVGRRLVLAVSEEADGRDHDDDADDHVLLASIDPVEETMWVFEHRSGIGEVQGDGNFHTTFPYVGASWMAPEPQESRLPIAYQEEVSGLTLNTNLFGDAVVKDTDTMDSIVAWPRVRSEDELDAIEPNYPLTFPGAGYAVYPTNPGFEIVGAHIYFRVSEAADNRDYNQDGDEADPILFRSALNQNSFDALATASLASGPVLFTDGQEGAAFFVSESHAGVDFNEDGDEDDLVVRYFVL